MSRHGHFFAAAGVLLLAARGAGAEPHVGLPTVNLGQSSFFDGFGSPGIGVGDSVVVYHAPSYAGPDGTAAPGSNTLSYVSSTTALGYVAPWDALGGHIGARVSVVVADVSVTSGGATTQAGGLGDIWFAPIVYQLPPLAVGSVQIRHRILLDLILPAGAYDPKARLNLGTHVFAFNPFYALTALAGRFEASFRLYYLWCGENGEPPPTFKASSIQPGEAVHMNAAASYGIAKGFRAGIGGYFLKQTTDQHVDGASFQGSREQVIALGPGLGFFSGPFQFIANAYWELAVENRFAGARSNVAAGYVWR